MAVDGNTPVSVIDGIGPVMAKALGRIGVHGVFDLLRATADRLHAVVKADASRAQAMAWRSQAALLQVAAVTPEWAAALAAAGVRTVDALAAKTPSAVAQILGTTATVPTADQIGEMQKDAVVLGWSGSIAGTILDHERKPIAGVTASVGAARITTDERGRFRLCRIKLATTLPLRLEHPEYKTKLVNPAPISSNATVIGAQRFQLEKGRPAKAPVLSELDGDLIAMPPGQPIKEQMAPVDTLKEGDILVLLEIYANGTDGRLASLFKILEDGVVIVRNVRVPLARLEGDPAPSLRATYKFDGRRFTRVEMKPSAVTVEKVLRRLTKTFADRPPPHGPKQRAALVAEKHAFLMENAFFAEEKRR
jgi:hypothetical protein